MRIDRPGGPGAGKAAAGTTNTYTVQAGDTLKSIASAKNVKLDALAKANSLPTDAKITRGQELTIPAATEAKTAAAKTSTKSLTSNPAETIQKVLAAARKINPSDLKSAQVSPEIARAIDVLRGGQTGAHVNSGPPGFVNGGGHANFDPKVDLASRTNTLDLSRAGSHVNSGPPGFVNGGGHANFDPKVNLQKAQQVTLPDGGVVRLPAQGTIDIMVRGFRITRG